MMSPLSFSTAEFGLWGKICCYLSLLSISAGFSCSAEIKMKIRQKNQAGEYRCLIWYTFFCFTCVILFWSTRYENKNGAILRLLLNKNSLPENRRSCFPERSLFISPYSFLIGKVQLLFSTIVAFIFAVMECQFLIGKVQQEKNVRRFIRRVDAVSYTHLDVYKRQDLGWHIIPESSSNPETYCSPWKILQV